MSAWGDMMRRSSGEIIREEDKFKVDASDTHLTKDEKNDIEILLCPLYCDLRHRDILSIKDGVGNQVELSEKRKTYLELFKERGFDPKKDETDQELQAIRVLGEYKDGIIILYINNIKDCANESKAPALNGKPYLTVTRYVYLHELMHAFFGSKENYKYNQELEEGLAEFGALFLLNQFANTTPNGTSMPENPVSKEELEWAVRHVEKKTGVLECYYRGAYLFKLFGHDKELSKKMLEAYPKSVE